MDSLPPEEPNYLTYDDIASRWRCHRSTAKRRLTLAGFPVLRFSDTAHPLIKFSDLEKFEQARFEVLQYEHIPARRVRILRPPKCLKTKAWRKRKEVAGEAP
jgi:hypothetical protein